MGFRDLVNKFTSGELDPKFLAEVDFDGYRKSARRLRNIIVTPQGVAQRRWGTIFEAALMVGGQNVTNRDEVRLIPYEFNADELYWIVIQEDAGFNVTFNIFLDDTIVAAVGTNLYTAAQIREIRWEQDIDRIILFHKDVRPQELRRTNSTTWALNQIGFQFRPTYDFTYQDDPADLPTANTPYWDAAVTITPNAAAATTMTGSVAIFTSNHVGGLIYGKGGVFRITSVNAAGTVATGYTIEDFPGASAIRGDLCAVLEVAWNDGSVVGLAPAGPNRGWPSRGAFYQSRLGAGNSPALPGTAFASVVKAYSDFDDSDSDASTGWGIELGVTGNDVITDIIAAKSLILLGNKGPASTSILIDTPTTPTNAFLNTQGTESSRNMDGVLLDNQIIYADKAGNTIWSMAYEIPDTGYNVQNASILSSHLIRNPRWADVYDPSAIDGRYYLLVNDDGTLAIYNTVIDENIHAWTLADTIGEFVDVATAGNEAKVLVKRRIASPLGVSATPSADYTVDSTFNAFRNITDTIDAGSNSLVFAEDEDYILVGNQIKFTQLSVTFNAPSIADLGLTFEFLNDLGTWEELTPVDGTLGFIQDGIIDWDLDDVSNWLAQPILRTTQTYGEYPNYYWLRIRRNNPVFIFPQVDILTMQTDTQEVIYLERFSFDEYMDCVIDTASDMSGLITGLNALQGQKAYFFANGFPIGNYTIDDIGEVTVEAKESTIKVGLEAPPILTPMPIVALLGNGVSVYEPAHVDYIYIDYYQSSGLKVDTFNVPNLIPGEVLSDSVPQPVSGFTKIATFKGWNPRTEFTITQGYPAPFIIRGISYTIEVNP